jgi:hypothetical protein
VHVFGRGRRRGDGGSIGSEDNRSAEAGASALFGSKIRVFTGRLNDVKETIGFDKWKQIDTFPRIALPIHVNVKITRVESSEWRRLFEHQRTMRPWKKLSASRWKARHKLFKGPKRRTDFEVETSKRSDNINYVGQHGTVVTWVKPTPIGAPLDIIGKTPRKALHKRSR